MRKFWVRILNVAVILVALFGYNMVIQAREQADEIARLNAELVSAQINAGSEDASASGSYTDGTYSGTAMGFGGDVTVEVLIEGGQITDLTIVSAEHEDGAYLAMAEDIIPAIIEAQSADVDTISGATFSSTGIKDATAQALEEAKQ